MKNIKTLTRSSLAALVIFACSKDDPIIEYVEVPGETVVETVVETAPKMCVLKTTVVHLK